MNYNIQKVENVSTVQWMLPEIATPPLQYFTVAEWYESENGRYYNMGANVFGMVS